jgi:hypothetical protein
MIARSFGKALVPAACKGIRNLIVVWMAVAGACNTASSQGTGAATSVAPIDLVADRQMVTPGSKYCGFVAATILVGLSQHSMTHPGKSCSPPKNGARKATLPSIILPGLVFASKSPRTAISSLQHPVKHCNQQQEWHETQDRVLQAINEKSADRNCCQTDQRDDFQVRR